jgi:acyl carrier protein
MPAPLTTADQVRALIAKHLSTEDPADDATLESLGADSLDNIEIVMAVEEQFRVEVTDDEAEACDTVGDWIAIVDTKLKEKN